MAELGRGRVAANGITFEYLEAGEGPLALCMHGFPDSATVRQSPPGVGCAGERSPATGAGGRRPGR